MVATKDRQEPLSTSAKIGARDVTLTILSPMVSKQRYDASLGFLFDSALPASKTPFERSGAILPATILVHGFKDNEKNTPFTLSLDYNKDSKKKSERAIRMTKIESDGEDGTGHGGEHGGNPSGGSGGDRDTGREIWEWRQYPSAGVTTESKGSSFKYRRRLSMNVAYMA
jgi:hypothetical protein